MPCCEVMRTFKDLTCKSLGVLLQYDPSITITVPSLRSPKHLLKVDSSYCSVFPVSLRVVRLRYPTERNKFSSLCIYVRQFLCNLHASVVRLFRAMRRNIDREVLSPVTVLHLSSLHSPATRGQSTWRENWRMRHSFWMLLCIRREAKKEATFYSPVRGNWAVDTNNRLGLPVRRLDKTHALPNHSYSLIVSLTRVSPESCYYAGATCLYYSFNICHFVSVRQNVNRDISQPQRRSWWCLQRLAFRNLLGAIQRLLTLYPDKESERRYVTLIPSYIYKGISAG